MTNREKINELGGVLLEPEGSGSDKYFLMVSEKWLDSEYKEPDHIADTSEMVEPTTKNNLVVDAISRQALLNATVKKSSIWNKTTDSKGENLETIISKLPSVTTRTRWIPVSERLPETDDEVLCWYEYYHWSQEKVLPEYGIGCYFKETSSWFGEVAAGRDVRVIAWMPLPQPYKTESEGKNEDDM